ncbi:ABC transporter substrate-binding protein [Dactylosporangium sp. NPDC005572]|uniref:ABC transporter substrate-binding protein n=1 Tax=Dactylosporangium sp. NPDC005572 TaxID=3156889 RepID=UPI0033BC158D
MRKRPLLATILCLPLLLAGACGDSGDEGGGTEQTIKLVGLWEIKGESSQAINDYHDGALLAVEDINAAGGIMGRKVVLDRVAIDPLNPQKATSQFLEAVDKDPDMLIGFPSATALISAKGQIDRSGIPLIATASASTALRFGSAGASEWAWYVQPYDEFKNQAAVRYVLEDLKATKVGLMGTNEAYGTTNIKSQTALLQQKGLTPFASRTYDATATDLTQHVLAMKGADAVISFTFPNPLAIEMKQFLQNGIDVPVFSSSSATLAVNNKLLTGEPLKNLHAVVPCDPASSTDAKVKAFGEKYKTKFNEVATSLAAGSYDAVWIAKAAIEKAGGTDPAAIKKAMTEINVTGNVICSGSYKADAAHMMNRDMAIVQYAADGSSKEIKRYTFEELPAATS